METRPLTQLVDGPATGEQWRRYHARDGCLSTADARTRTHACVTRFEQTPSFHTQSYE